METHRTEKITNLGSLFGVSVIVGISLLGAFYAYSQTKYLLATRQAERAAAAVANSGVFSPATSSPEEISQTVQ